MIKITHNRMVVSMSGADPDMFAPVLSYDHKSMEREWVFDERSGHNKLVERNVTETRPLYTVIDGNIVFQQGLLDAVFEFMKSKCLEYEYEDIGEIDCEPDYENFRRVMPDVEFRTNQDLVVSIVISLACGQIVASAAFGKSFCITVLCALYPDKNIVIATPGAQLAKDLHKRIKKAFPKEKVGLLGAGGKDIGRVTVTTYHSFHKYPSTKSDIIFIDESHRSSGPMLANALSRCIRVQKIFGFTASPEGRSDGAEKITESLLGPIRLNVPYTESVKQGLVSEMTVLMLDVLSGPNEKNFKQAITKQRNLLWKNIYRNKVIANAVREYTKEGNPLHLDDPQVLILVGTTQHLENLGKLLPDYTLVYNAPGKSSLPKMSTKEREEIFNRFQSQELKKVIATSCWGTGVDFPDLDIMVMASGKSGPIDVIQHTGRATRKGSGKKKMGYIIDCKDQWCNWGKYKSMQRRKLYKEMGWKIIEN